MRIWFMYDNHTFAEYTGEIAETPLREWVQARFAEDRCGAQGGSEVSKPFGADIPSSSSAGMTVPTKPCTCHPDDRPPQCPHLYAASECKAAYGVMLVRNLRGCHHGKTWTEYCRDCEIVGLREQYSNGLRKAENARQRLMAMGEVVAQSPVEEPEDEAATAMREADEFEIERLRETINQIAEWQAQGEYIFSAPGQSPLFALGRWWADRPWRTK